MTRMTGPPAGTGLMRIKPAVPRRVPSADPSSFAQAALMFERLT
jgi:hypothetical protein